jgi:hypothetical protein
MHEAPIHAAVRNSKINRRATPREQPHRAVVWGRGLRRLPLALGLLNAQRYKINDAR